MRYSVDPAILQTAAGHAGSAGQAASRAREQLLATVHGLGAWCPPELRRYVEQAVEVLADAALAAGDASLSTASRLVRAAEGYGVADRQVAR